MNEIDMLYKHMEDLNETILEQDKQLTRLHAALDEARKVIELAALTDGLMPSDMKARGDARMWLNKQVKP